MIKQAPDAPTDTPSTGRSANQSDQLRNRSHSHYVQWAVGDGATTLFFLEKTPRDVTQLAVYVAGLRKRPADRGTAYDWSLTDGNHLTFTAAPAAAANICIETVTT